MEEGIRRNGKVLKKLKISTDKHELRIQDMTGKKSDAHDSKVSTPFVSHLNKNFKTVYKECS